MAKRYRVLNPRGIPKGRHIISHGKDAATAKRWYEGDTFTPPQGFDLRRMLRDGFIEEVKGSG